MYIADFIDKDKYEFNYFYIRDTFNESEIKQGINKDRENLNFDLELKFQIGKDNYSLDDNPRFVILLDNVTLENMEDNIFHSNTRYFRLGVAYNCSGLPNCSIQEEDRIKVRSYFLNLYYKWFTLDHQDPEAPLKRSDEFTFKKIEFLENTNIIYLNWESIEYEEEKNIFQKTFDKNKGKSNTYYGGDLNQWNFSLMMAM